MTMRAVFMFNETNLFLFQGVNLNHMRSLGVGVSTSTEHHLKVLTIKGESQYFVYKYFALKTT